MTPFSVVALAPATAAYALLVFEVAGAGAVGDAFEADDLTPLVASSLATVTAPTTQYDDTTALLSTTYTYYATAIVGGVESPPSAPVAATRSAVVAYAGFGIRL
jgi:hypothetical protein